LTEMSEANSCRSMTLLRCSQRFSNQAINEKQLLQILPNAGRKAGVFVPGLNATMGKHAIVARLRMAAFLAQIGHKSGQLQYVRELGNDK